MDNIKYEDLMRLLFKDIIQSIMSKESNETKTEKLEVVSCNE